MHNIITFGDLAAFSTGVRFCPSFGVAFSFVFGVAFVFGTEKEQHIVRKGKQ